MVGEHSIQRHGEVIEIVVTGRLDSDRALAVCHQLVAEAGDLRTFLINVTQVPIDHIDVGESMVISAYKVYSMMSTIFPPGSRVAMLAADGQRPRDLTGFAEDVTSNRGLALRYFSRRTEALEWLGGEGGGGSDL